MGSLLDICICIHASTQIPPHSYMYLFEHTLVCIHNKSLLAYFFAHTYEHTSTYTRTTYSHTRTHGFLVFFFPAWLGLYNEWKPLFAYITKGGVACIYLEAVAKWPWDLGKVASKKETNDKTTTTPKRKSKQTNKKKSSFLPVSKPNNTVSLG